MTSLEELLNPYIAGPPVQPSCFYGRSRLLAELWDLRYTCFYLVGIRRIGKTSVLRSLEALAPSGTVPLFISLQRASSRQHEYGLDETQLSRLLLRQARQARCKQLNLAGVRQITDPIECLEALTEAAEEAGVTLWLLWDEAELLATLPAGSLKALRPVLLESPSLRTVLTANKGLGGLNDVCRDWRVSPFLFGFATRFISMLEETEAKSLIEQRENPDGSVQVEEKTVWKLLEACGGHPYLLQALCLRLFDPRQRRLRPLTDSDVDRAYNEEGFRFVFQQDYDSLSPSEKAILKYLGQNGVADETSLVRITDLPIEGARALLMGLVQVGLVCRDNGAYRLGFGLLRRWLRSGMVEERRVCLTDQASREVVEAAVTGDYSPVMLAQVLSSRFDLEELRNLCFDLGVDYDNLRGESKGAKARELVAYFQRWGELEHLVVAVRRKRGDIV